MNMYLMISGIHVAWHSACGSHVGIRAGLGEGAKDRVWKIGKNSVTYRGHNEDASVNGCDRDAVA